MTHQPPTLSLFFASLFPPAPEAKDSVCLRAGAQAPNHHLPCLLSGEPWKPGSCWLEWPRQCLDKGPGDPSIYHVNLPGFWTWSFVLTRAEEFRERLGVCLSDLEPAAFSRHQLPLLCSLKCAPCLSRGLLHGGPQSRLGG